MIQAADRDASRSARTLLNKHGLDISRAQISVVHGICHIRGLVTAIAGHEITDVEVELNKVALLIRQKNGVRSVVVEVSFR